MTLSITPSLFHSGLKASPFCKSFPRSLLVFFRTDSTDSPDCLPILLSISVFLLYSFFLSVFPLFSISYRHRSIREQVPFLICQSVAAICRLAMDAVSLSWSITSQKERRRLSR